MCGIVGIHSFRGPRPVPRQVLAAMNGTLRHRGPDSEGSYLEADRIGLAMRRLSIIDVAGGDQPIPNEDGSVQVVFNGEIFNFRDLRRELESRGHRFRTDSDTEAIVHAYEEWGDDCLQRLRGMFAFALWDGRLRRLLLARDRIGVKQLFYTVSQDQLLWGSEIKALLAHPAVSPRLRPSSVNHFLTWLYVPEPLTPFEDIHELPAGHLLAVRNGQIELRRWWQLRYEVDPSLDERSAADGLRERLDEAVRIRLISDVPLGAFLSGGIDSGSMVALMARHSDRAVETFTIGYDRDGEQFDERAYAREIVDRYGTRHHEFLVQPDLVDMASKVVRAFDAPQGDASSIPTWYIAGCTRRHVTVALSGVGGDELFAGYERHRGAVLAERLRWLPGWMVRKLLEPLAAALPDSRSGNPWRERAKRFTRSLTLPFDERYFELLSAFSRQARAELLSDAMLEQIALDEPKDLFRSYTDLVSDASPLHRALFADLKLFLPSNLLTLTDRMSMAHSLEVRVPFLDHVLVEFAARIPARLKLQGTERKHVLKKAVADLLPASFLRRRKMGFSLPLAVWFRGELRPWVEDLLSDAAVRRAGVFRPAAVRRLLDDHFALRANHDNRIWALMTFAIWHREYLESGARAAAGAGRQ